MREAVIGSVRIAAAHDGVAELVVGLKHENGGTSEVALDQLAVDALLNSCGVSEPDQLVGQSWSKVRDAMAVSWNRYHSSQGS